ncbi:hypothetical protein GDO81_029261 [Engystomops pustulosus]|uniref:Uncharacterized protein n=1 Tax=Engystomops pustulosus TaxID=76066 RepID=A0AAV6YMF1_ENGPU|nr:hypothetical protein GDO81_029261 [Engystomops pustulosus]
MYRAMVFPKPDIKGSNCFSYIKTFTGTKDDINCIICFTTNKLFHCRYGTPNLEGIDGKVKFTEIAVVALKIAFWNFSIQPSGRIFPESTFNQQIFHGWVSSKGYYGCISGYLF